MDTDFKSHNHTTLRSYVPSDKNELLEIFKLNTPIYFDPKEVNDFYDYLDHYGETYLTIEQNNLIIGGTGYVIKENENNGSITWIFFHPDLKGSGLGKIAVNHCLLILKSHPAVKKLSVRTSQYANQFFGKFGFNLVKVVKDYWAPGLDLYEMEMPNHI